MGGGWHISRLFVSCPHHKFDCFRIFTGFIWLFVFVSRILQAYEPLQRRTHKDLLAMRITRLQNQKLQAKLKLRAVCEELDKAQTDQVHPCGGNIAWYIAREEEILHDALLISTSMLRKYCVFPCSYLHPSCSIQRLCQDPNAWNISLDPHGDAHAWSLGHLSYVHSVGMCFTPHKISSSYSNPVYCCLRALKMSDRFSSMACTRSPSTVSLLCTTACTTVPCDVPRVHYTMSRTCTTQCPVVQYTMPRACTTRCPVLIA